MKLELLKICKSTIMVIRINVFENFNDTFEHHEQASNMDPKTMTTS